MLSFSVLQCLPVFVQIHVLDPLMLSNHLMLCRPLLLLLLPSIFPSIGVFSNESALPIRWPKCWSFSFSVSPSNEYSGLSSFRMDWFDLFAIMVVVFQSLFPWDMVKAQLDIANCIHSVKVLLVLFYNPSSVSRTQKLLDK